MGEALYVLLKAVGKLLGEGEAALGPAIKVLGSLALFQWMYEHPLITVGALSVGVYGLFAAFQPTKQ